MNRKVEQWSLQLNFSYQDHLWVKGSISTSDYGVKQEKYRITYKNDEWKFVEVITNESNPFIVKAESDGSYTITLDVEAAIDNNLNFGDNNPDDYDKIVLTGEFNDWTKDPNEDYKYKLTGGDGDNVWKLQISNQANIDELEANKFKVIAFTKDGDVDWAPPGIETEQYLSDWVEITN